MKTCNLLVVSDLHLCEGFNAKTGKFSRMEDFLFDDAFGRMLRYHESVRQQPRFGGRPWLLILNGDIFDFLQVVSLPDEGLMLRLVKGVEQHCDLPPQEQAYGLGITPIESEWKMKQIARGHQNFFAALGWFIAHGNHVAMIKGNHDIELHWSIVRERFLVEVERSYVRQRLARGWEEPLDFETITDSFHFYPWFYYEPGVVYIEHGGQYESSSHFPNFLQPVDPDHSDWIWMPWGSLFVRYLFNEVEDVHPFADNVKPPVRYFVWAFRQAPLMTIKLLITRGWVFVRAFWNIGRKTIAYACAPREDDVRRQFEDESLPCWVAQRIAQLARQRTTRSTLEFLGTVVQGIPVLLALVLLIVLGVTIFNARWGWAFVCMFGLAGVYLLHRVLKGQFSDVLDDYMLRVGRDIERILGDEYAVRYIVFGHDHKADVERLNHSWYVNTGTWVQIYEKDGPIEGREKLTFFRLVRGELGSPALLRWDDGAGEPTRLVLGLLD